MPEANYHIVENSTIEKIFINSKAEEEVKGKTKGKEGKDKGKSNGKSKEKPGEIKIDWGKNMLHMQKDISIQFPERHITFDVFSTRTNLDGIVKLLADQINLYTQ